MWLDHYLNQASSTPHVTKEENEDTRSHKVFTPLKMWPLHYVSLTRFLQCKNKLARQRPRLKQAHNSSFSGQEIWSHKPIRNDFLIAYLTDNSSLRRYLSFFSVPHPNSCFRFQSWAIIHIQKLLHYVFNVFLIMEYFFFLFPTWIWGEMVTRSFSSYRGIFYPSPRSKAPAKLNKPVFCLSTALQVSLQLNFPANWALKGKYGSGQKGSQSNLGQYGFFINLKNAASTFDQTLTPHNFSIL